MKYYKQSLRPYSERSKSYQQDSYLEVKCSATSHPSSTSPHYQLSTMLNKMLNPNIGHIKYLSHFTTKLPQTLYIHTIKYIERFYGTVSFIDLSAGGSEN